MIRFLTDEHISPAVAAEVIKRCPAMEIVSIHDWKGGQFVGAEDEVFLREAALEGATLVTYDQKTIPPLLKVWAEAGLDHSGIVFIDHKTIAPQNIGRLVAALCHLWKVEKRAIWTNRVMFLRAAPKN